jgi:hypothetical protein
MMSGGGYAIDHGFEGEMIEDGFCAFFDLPQSLEHKLLELGVSRVCDLSSLYRHDVAMGEIQPLLKVMEMDRFIRAEGQVAAAGRGRSRCRWERGSRWWYW